MVRKRFIPASQEFFDYVKLFFICVIVWAIILFIWLGCDKWAAWGAVGIGFLAAIPTTIVILLLTGVKEQ